MIALKFIAIAGTIGFALGIAATLLGHFLKTRTRPRPDPYEDIIGEGH